MIIPIGLVLAILTGGIVMYFYVPKYEATALLMIEDVGQFVAFSSQSGQSQRYVQTQLELLRSPVVLQPVLSRSEIAAMDELTDVPDRVTFLRDRLTIKPVGQSELYNIAYTSESPQAAANMVNATIAEYLKLHSGEDSQRSQQVIDILEEERNRRGLFVEQLRKRVVDLAKEVTGRDPFAGRDVDVNRVGPVGAMFQSLIQTEVDLEIRRAEMASLAAEPANGSDKFESTGLLDLEVENNSEIHEQQKAIREIEAGMEAVKRDVARYAKEPRPETDPRYVALKTEWEQGQKELAETKKKRREMILLEHREKLEEERAETTAKMKREMELLASRKQLLGERFKTQVKELQSGGGKSVELEFARAELAREDKVFEMIAGRKLALQTELRAPARVQLRQKAFVPTVPVDAIPYKFLFLSCSAAFVAPFGLAVLREIAVRRISDVEQLAQESGVRVLGEVASLPVRYLAVSPAQLSGKLRKDTYIFVESINSLRTNLALAAGLNEQQVIAVTSASPREGKTSVAVSLAMSIANAIDQPTLVIDGDMRSPAVASMLKAKNQPGLFEALTQKCKLDDVIQRVGDSQLYVIPGGRANRSTHSVVGMTEVTSIVDQLRSRFSRIVIDTPPILGASESLVFAKAADCVLFCSLCDISKAKQVRLAIDRLEHAQVNIAGAVLSGTSARRYAYIYGYYANRIEASN